MDPNPLVSRRDFLETLTDALWSLLIVLVTSNQVLPTTNKAFLMNNDNVPTALHPSLHLDIYISIMVVVVVAAFNPRYCENSRYFELLEGITLGAYKL